MKDLAAIFLILAVLVLSLWNQWNDNEEIGQHHTFFNDVRKFMNKGDRNTRDMGLLLCERLNRIEKVDGLDPTNCKEIYKQQNGHE